MPHDGDRPQRGALRALARAIDGGVLLIRPDLSLDFASDGALRLLAAQGSDGAADPAPDGAAAWARLLPLLQSEPGALAAESRIQTVEYQAGTERRRLRVRIDPLRSDDCVGYLVLLRDRDVVAALETELRLAARFLGISRMYEALAHDLRGALNAMALNIALLRELTAERADPDAEEVTAANAIDREFKRFRGVFDLLLRHGEFPNDRVTSFDVRDLLRELQVILEPLARRRRIAFSLELPRTALPVQGRYDALRQAILNATLGGIDRSGKDGRLSLDASREGEWAVVSLTDSSVLADPDRALQLLDVPFRPLRRGESGLGLYVVRNLVEEHGGRVEVGGAKGVDLCLRMFLPIQGTQR